VGAQQKRRNDGVYAIDINCGTGFFAQLTWCLFILEHCERTGLCPYLRLSSPHYARQTGSNWLDDFFEQSAAAGIVERAGGAEGIGFTTIRDIDELGLTAYPKAPLTIAEGHRLLNKYLAVQPEIRGYVDTFRKSRFSSGKVLGLHFRGTDKNQEATPISQHEAVELLCRYLDLVGDIGTVFVASDEQAFVDRVAQRLKTVDVIWHEDTIRSHDGRAIHNRMDVGDNHAKGFEALVNCMLLSHCDVLLRTASFMSAWSSIFRPTLPVVMLNRPIASRLWFPDREILRGAVSLCLPERRSSRLPGDVASNRPSEI
jgi:hypothetical protein